MPRLLFAYGTLISGALSREVGAALRQHCRSRGAAWVHGRLLDLGDYPGAIKAPGRVYGELIELLAPERCLRLFDLYEDYDPESPQTSLYLRETATAHSLEGDGRRHCWIYWLKDRVAAPEIPSGDWRQHLVSRSDRA